MKVSDSSAMARPLMTERKLRFILKYISYLAENKVCFYYNDRLVVVHREINAVYCENHTSHTNTQWARVVSCVRILAKNAYYHGHVCPHVSTRLPIDAFPLNLILDTSINICRETRNLVTIGHGDKYVPAILNRHKNALFE